MPFQSASRAYASWAPLRRRRVRQYNYTFGRQWLDPVTDASGTTVTEGEFTERMGKKPLSNNLLRQMVKTVVGRFRHSLAASGADTRPRALRAIAEANLLDELDCRMLEEFLISGCAIQRVVAERRPAGEGVWVDNVSPDAFFVNPFTDPRGCDIELIGMVHDMSFAELAARFASGPADAARLRALYRGEGSDTFGAISGPFGMAPRGRCRAVEVWTLDAAPALRCHDPAAGSYAELPAGAAAPEGCDVAPDTAVGWVCRWYAPSGTLLASYPSPWPHGGHPFAVKLYPLTGGEIHSLIDDTIDQQRYVNRLITLIDHVIGTSAKGALLFPVDQLPQGYRWDDVAAQWARPDGIIPYQPGPSGAVPRQLVSGREPTSAYHLLDVEMRLMQQVSGVSDALGGIANSSNSRSAALFESQTTASSIALLDTFAAFNSFRAARDRLILGL